MSEASPTPGAATPVGTDGQWLRVHPLTPLVRSWQMVAVAVFFFGQDLLQRRVGLGSDLPDGVTVPNGLSRTAWLAGGGVVLLVLAGLLGLAFLSWRMTRYCLTAESIEISSGVLFRQHRSAQLDRIQGVDVVQPLLGRIFGLARLDVEVAGSGKSTLSLAYLTDDAAHELRNRLLARAAGLHVDAASSAPMATEERWLELPLGRLLGSIALSAPTLLFGLFVGGALVVSATTGRLTPLGVIGGLGPFVVAMVGITWSRFVRGFGFTAAAAADGLRVRSGLLERRTQTVPPGRIQAVRLSQPLLWRLPGWWTVQVNVAGFGLTGDHHDALAASTLLPVGTRDEALSVLAFALPDLGVEEPAAVVDAGLIGIGPGAGFVGAPAAARWVDPLVWRRTAYRLTRTALVLRRGLLTRELILVPHAKVQSLRLRQGPLSRRLGLATVQIHSTPGPVVPTLAHLAEATAAELVRDETAAARAGRATAGPEKWLHGSGAVPPVQVTPPPPPPVQVTPPPPPSP